MNGVGHFGLAWNPSWALNYDESLHPCPPAVAMVIFLAIRGVANPLSVAQITFSILFYSSQGLPRNVLTKLFRRTDDAPRYPWISHLYVLLRRFRCCPQYFR